MYEGSGILGARDSFFVTEEVRGQRLDDAIGEDLDQLRLIGHIVSFFKRMEWIKFMHGDAKVQFFLDGNGLVVFDLDSSRKLHSTYFFNKFIKKDKKRILRSLKGHRSIYDFLSKEIKGKAILRIGILSYRSHPYSGGQGIYIKHLSKALSDRSSSFCLIWPALSRVR